MILEVPVTIPVVQFVHVKARVFFDTDAPHNIQSRSNKRQICVSLSIICLCNLNIFNFWYAFSYNIPLI